MFDPMADAALVYPVATECLPRDVLREGAYEVRFALSAEELDEVLRLRFEVFNVELGEGLEASWSSGRDQDRFDAVCHHLIVLDHRDGRIVGTYRVQTAAMAGRHFGLYSSGEFDLSDLPEEILESSVEVGRACVAPSHRNSQVLFLLWRGLAMYMSSNRLQYLFGCCSLTSQDPVDGLVVLRYLESRGHLHPNLRCPPLPGLECVSEAPLPEIEVQIPHLFRIYLRHGAKVCGPPAIDREFKTIDFLVLFDVAALDERRVRTFFG
ncbi:MAG: GNAT family N-acyltransferase [Acidobacteriota bacterium]